MTNSLSISRSVPWLVLLGLAALPQLVLAQEPVFELLADTSDDRRQVEMLWRQPASGEGPWPAILFVHGYQPIPYNEKYAPGAKAMLESPPRYPLFEMFREKGYLVAAVSQSGYGRTDGPLDFCGPFSQQAIATAIDALTKHPKVLGDQIFLHGRSRGAVASSMVATRNTELAGVILESGVYDLKSEHALKIQENVDPHVYMAVNIELEAGKTDEVFRDRSVLLMDRGIPVPTLIIPGAEDPNAGVSQAIRLERHLRERGSSVRLEVFEDEGHKVPAEVVAPLIQDFIERAVPVKVLGNRELGPGKTVVAAISTPASAI